MSPSSSAGLVTPEAVLLGLEPAGLGSRALAWAIDTAIVAVSIAGVAIGAGLVGEGAGATAAVVLFLIVTFGIFFGYPIAFEVLWHGRTPGKAVMRLRVVTTEGLPVRFRHSAVRAALSLVDIWATGGAAGTLAVLLTGRAQRLGDLAAGTLVVSVPRADAVVAHRFEVPAQVGRHVEWLDVSGLSADDLAGVRRFALRSPDLTPDVRDRVARRLWEAIEPRLGGVPDGINDGDAGAGRLRPADLLLAVAAIASGQPADQPPPPDPWTRRQP